ncbi:MAG: VOC family protein [Gemmatimonadota bacterium]|nr:VOC family protein [Gemmatimonadota bacterium]
MPHITPFLAYAEGAEDAAAFYVSLFPGSRITGTTPFPPGSPLPAGSVMTVAFELEGRPYVALNGGPHFSFTDAFSLSVECDTQEEIDHYWERLSEGGEAGPCGWLVDRFGMSWQVNPRALADMLADPDPARAGRVMEAALGMSKFDIAALEEAYGDGAP